MEVAVKPIKVCRRVLISQKAERYLSFPDVVRMRSGKLICAFRDADIHYPASEADTWLNLCWSEDDGQTWSGPEIFPHEPNGKTHQAWHCPRLQLLADGRLALLCDRTIRDRAPEVYLSFSSDDGLTWSKPIATGAYGILPDRLIALSLQEFLFTAHWKDPDTHTLVQKLYASTDGGVSWGTRSVIAANKDFNFCEGSIVHVSGKRLVCYLRENSFVHHSTFVSFSDDCGFTWSTPVSHPTHGHRPCAGALDKDTLLITYRDVSANPGLCAWTGSTVELGFVPALRNLNGRAVATLPEGLEISTSGAPGEGAELMLHPLKNWDTQFQLDARIKCLDADDWGCVVSGAGYLRITPRKVSFHHYPDETSPDTEICFGESPISPGDFHFYSLCYANRTVSVWANGVKIISGQIGASPVAWQRKISLGNSYPGEPWKVHYDKHRGVSIWDDLRLKIYENKEEVYAWSWNTASTSFPNDHEQRRVNRICEETSSDLYESGYSGWTRLSDRYVYCVNYERNDAAKPYIVGYVLELYGVNPLRY